MDTNTSCIFPLCKNVLFKILTHLCFGFILCRKKRQLKYCIACTAKHVHVQYKQHNLRVRFLCPTLYIYDACRRTTERSDADIWRRLTTFHRTSTVLSWTMFRCVSTVQRPATRTTRRRRLLASSSPSPASIAPAPSATGMSTPVRRTATIPSPVIAVGRRGIYGKVDWPATATKTTPIGWELLVCRCRPAIRTYRRCSRHQPMNQPRLLTFKPQATSTNRSQTLLTLKQSFPNLTTPRLQTARN